MAHLMVSDHRFLRAPLKLGALVTYFLLLGLRKRKGIKEWETIEGERGRLPAK